MPDPWVSGDVNEMMGQLMASTPSPTPTGDGVMPPGFESGTGGDSGQPTDWSWLTSLFSGTSIGGGFSSAEGQLNQWPDFGSFFRQSPSTQLATAIADQMVKKAGNKPFGYRVAAAVARQAAQRAESDSNYRQQLATWLGWNQDNPHVQYWIAQGGGIPADPTNKQVALPTGGPGTGVTGTGQAPSTATDPSAAKVQVPFPAQFFNNPSYQGNNYGQPKPPGVYWGGWQWHQGQDYGVPQGTPLSFPFAGKIVATGYDPHGYGNYVTVEFGDQGLRMTYAHLSYVGVKDGETIAPGASVGLSGGSGPGSGISTGAHLLVVLQDARGNPIDPRPLLQQVYSGATLGQLEKLGVGSTGTTNAGGSYTTPDGHVIWPGTPDDAAYNMVADPYKKYYGTMPPWSMVMAMRQQGIQNTEQMAAVAANWPSDIPGVTFAQRENIYNNASSIAIKKFGRPIPDSLVKQLAQQGLTSASEIQLWFDTHTSDDIPKADYQQIYDAANPAFQSTYGDSPSPEYIGYLWGQNQAPTAQIGTSPSTTPPVTAPP